MSTHLLDANVLIALVVIEHEHHHAARQWFQEQDSTLLCSVVEGALVRTLLRLGERGDVAAQVLRALHDHSRVDFLTESPSYTQVDLGTLRGHRQVTDEYLVMLAARAGVKLATFDRALGARHPEHVTRLG